MTELPIDLRSKVIDPFLLNPDKRISIEIEAILPLACRRDAKEYTRVGLPNGLCYCLHHQINIVGPPGMYILSCTIFQEGILVVEPKRIGGRLCPGGIKKIVKMDGINIIFRNNLLILFHRP